LRQSLSVSQNLIIQRLLAATQRSAANERARLNVQAGSALEILPAA